MYYFAYGSNMKFERMKKRCPGSKFLSKATLKGYKFVYDWTSKNGGSVGNIIKDSIESVSGGLFEIDTGHVKSLDGYEGYPTSYDRKDFLVKTADGKEISAIAYFRTGKLVGPPHPEYRKIVIQGARDCGLPEEYIQIYL